MEDKALIKRGWAALLMILFLIPAAARAERTYGAWLPYWEIDASLDEAQALDGRLDTAIAFAAILDENDRPFLLGEAEELLLAMNMQLGGTGTRVLLSVVNDVQVREGEYENKSTEPLRRLFADEESMDAHIGRLLRLVDAYGLDGLEIDYENLQDDAGLWAQYADFIGRLYEKMAAEGLTLRIVLSWDAPRYVQLPAGPEYTVMCYNLYGYHSGPGPKADYAFLDETAALYQEVPGEVRMAFATGGFDWVGDSVDRALTQQEAEQILREQGVTPIRDEESGALYVHYQREGEAHTVWYADAVTLSLWCGRMEEQGYHSFDFFRLGGNVLSDWEENLF